MVANGAPTSCASQRNSLGQSVFRLFPFFFFFQSDKPRLLSHYYFYLYLIPNDAVCLFILLLAGYVYVSMSST